ncbi:acyltransferase family protein [Hymenobacter arcticus]
MITNPSPVAVPVVVIPPIRHLSYQELDILHCLRGFCAFYVVVYHAKYILWSGGHDYLAVFPRVAWSIWQYVAFAFDMLSSAGYEMVIFFFVLSGFFIRYAQQRKPRAAASFYLNRAVRIYPPYLASALLAAGGLALIGHFVPQMLTKAEHRELNSALLVAWDSLRHFNLLALTRTLVFLPGQGNLFIGYNSVYWSLLPEALFYLSVPLAFWRIRAYYGVSLLFYLLGIGNNVFHYNGGFIIDFLITYNFYFAVGVALYDVVVRTAWLTWFRQASGWLLGISILLLAVLLLPLAILKLKVLSGLVAVLLAVLAISALLAGRVARRNLAVRAFHPVGVFSFSLYLYHFPLLILCGGLLVSTTGSLVNYTRYYWLAIPVVTLACYVLYWITERVSVNFFRKM